MCCIVSDCVAGRATRCMVFHGVALMRVVLAVVVVDVVVECLSYYSSDSASSSSLF